LNRASALMSYSRIPLVMAADGFLPRAFAKTDSRGTPRNAVLFSAVFYSVFTLVPFGRLVVADVLLYAMALFLEFGALLMLRRREPALRGPFRIPAGLKTVCILVAVPVLILAGAVALEIHDGQYGLPAVLGALVAAGLGPLVYFALPRKSAAA